MSERAYSIELQKKVKKSELSYLFKTGQLIDIHAFYCLDPGCQIPLTAKATNSSKRSPHFILQHNDQPHISTCTEVAPEENLIRFEIEKNKVKSLLHSKKLQTFAAPKPITARITKKTKEDEGSISSHGTITKTKGNSTTSIQQIDTTTRSLDIMVDAFENSHEKSEVFRISFPFENRSWPDISSFNIKATHGKKTLNNIFYPISEIFPYNEFKIFFGEVYLEEVKDDLISINFVQNNSLHLNTNKQKLLNLPEKEIIREALEKRSPLLVYCQGAIELIRLKTGEEFRIVTVTNHIYRSLFFKSCS